jgi:hypothetical protein
MRITLTAVVVAALLAPAAASADLYRYETEQGTIAFTDDPERIPARYRASATREAPRDLASYPRLTIVPRGATVAPPPAAEAEPQEASAPQPEQAVTAAAPAPRATYEIGLGGGSALELPVDPTKPVVVRRYQWRYVDDGALGTWKPFTVIEQDGEVLAEIEPH